MGMIDKAKGLIGSDKVDDAVDKAADAAKDQLDS